MVSSISAGRRKRMIITSGYNVYPAQLENILEAHEAVQRCCIIGVPDSYKMQKVKAFVMLKPGFPATEETKQEHSGPLPQEHRQVRHAL